MKVTVCRNCGKKIKFPDEGYTICKEFGHCQTCYPQWNDLFFRLENEINVRDFSQEGDRHIGFELECNPSLAFSEFIFRNRLATLKKDGSLRGNNPVEFVTPKIAISKLDDYLDVFFSKFSSSQFYRRTSLHVHLETNGMSWFAINLLMAKLKSIELLIAAGCPPSRFPVIGNRADGGPRALPVTPVFAAKEDFLKFCYGPSELRARSWQKTSKMKLSKRCNDNHEAKFPGGSLHRYHWYNIHGHFYKGAVENRIFPATGNKEKLRNWIRMNLAIIQAAERVPAAKFLNGDICDYIPNDVWLWWLGRIESNMSAHINNGTLYADNYDLSDSRNPLRKITGTKFKFVPHVEIPLEPQAAAGNDNQNQLGGRIAPVWHAVDGPIDAPQFIPDQMMEEAPRQGRPPIENGPLMEELINQLNRYAPRIQNRGTFIPSEWPEILVDIIDRRIAISGPIRPVLLRDELDSGEVQPGRNTMYDDHINKWVYISAVPPPINKNRVKNSIVRREGVYRWYGCRGSIIEWRS